MNCLAAAHPAKGHPFLLPPFSLWPAERLLEHFRTRGEVRYFPLSNGKAKHVPEADRILVNEFEFNNEIHHLPEPIDWRANPSADLEWAILLHKFYYVRDLALAYDYTRDERYAAKWVQLLESWIRDIPEGFIDSQVTGRRLQQWLLSFQYFVRKNPSESVTPEFLLALLGSLASQVHYLADHLTPEGNHRTLELSAVFFIAVSFPEFRGARELREFAMAELLANMEQDLLPDGVHRELSTDYHHTVLKNYLRAAKLASLNGIRLPDQFNRHIRRALEFSLYIHKPDGSIPAISDGDTNSYLSLLKSALAEYPDDRIEYVQTCGQAGRPPEQRSKLFPESGYAILRDTWSAKPYRDAHYLFFDCGPLGFGSHGHYDLLNIEIAAYGRSLIVDPGRYTYSEASNDGLNWRHAFKGTAAHNTVLVDGKDQMAYHCHRPQGPEPTAELLAFVSAPGFDFIRGRAISPEYPVIHERAIFFALPEYWVITDYLAANDEHRYELNFHLAPEASEGCQVTADSDVTLIESPNLILAQTGPGEIEAGIAPGYFSPEYGVKYPAPVARFTQKKTGNGVFQTILYPFKDEAPQLSSRNLPVFDGTAPADPFDCIAVEIDIAEGTETYRDQLLKARRPAREEFRSGDLACRADLLFLRRDSAGRIVNLQAEGLEYLQIGGKALFSFPGEKRRIGYTGGWLHLAGKGEVHMAAIGDLESWAAGLTSGKSQP